MQWTLASLLVLGTAAIAVAEPKVEVKPTNGHTEFTLDGYLQPQFRIRENSPVDDDTNGFRFARVRTMLRGKTTYGALDLSSTLEFEVQPVFEMLDAFFGVKGKLGDDGSLTVDVGQMRTPLSRQQMLSDSRLQFIDKAQLATIAADRDLGARVTFVVPGLDQLKIWAGVYGGNGINTRVNLDEKFLYIGRIAYTVLGTEDRNEESIFGDDYLTIGVSGGHNRVRADDNDDTRLMYGADIAGAYRGFSGSVEWLEVAHDVRATDPSSMVVDFKQNGWSGQLAYMLPMKLWRESRLEVGARVEEIDRNDEVPVTNPGDPEQAQRIYTAVMTYYLRKHALKATLAFNHIIEIDDKTVTQEDASYDNDQLVLQFTYRME